LPGFARSKRSSPTEHVQLALRSPGRDLIEPHEPGDSLLCGFRDFVSKLKFYFDGLISGHLTAHPLHRFALGLELFFHAVRPSDVAFHFAQRLLQEDFGIAVEVLGELVAVEDQILWPHVAAYMKKRNILKAIMFQSRASIDFTLDGGMAAS
jgi:hypothetical protein